MSKHIIIGQSTNINVFSWLLFFFKLKERESGIQNLGLKGKWPQSYLSYFSTGFPWRIFLLSRANRLFSIFFFTGLKNLGSLVSQIFFCLQPGILAMVRLPATNPAQKLTFLLFTSAEGGNPTSVLESRPIIWLLSPSSSGVRRPEVTKYQHLLISPLWPTFSLNGHFFYG